MSTANEWNIFSTREEKFRISIYHINTNEIPNHFTLIVFWCERRACSLSNGDVFTCEDNMLFSHVKISCFRAKAHVIFHWCLYNKTMSLISSYLFVYHFQRQICTWKEKPGVDSTVPSEQPGTDTRESEQRRGIQGYNSSRTKTTHGRKTRTACQVSWVSQRTKQFQLVFTLIWSCSV